VINNTPIGIRTLTNSNGSLHGSIVINNMKLNNVPSAIAVADGTVILAGSTGTATVASWGMGNVYSGKNSQGHFVQGNIPAGNKDASLLDSTGRIFSRGHPQYSTYDVSQFVSARSAGAKGDGVTDDTAALQALFNSAVNCQIVFLDAGVYYITNTRAFLSGFHACRLTFLFSEDPRWYSSRRRGLECDHGRRCGIQQPEEPESGRTGRRCGRQGCAGDHRCHVSLS
jgi:glucan 1,3-beta-glucosidase